MENPMRDIAARLKGMREILELSVREMAEATGVSTEEYLKAEAGEVDFSFMFLYQAAKRFKIDLTELLTGESPRRSGYTLIRKGQGLPIKRREGFEYFNLAPFFKGRLAEPFEVTAPGVSEPEKIEIALNSHKGQELDYILSGSLRVQIGEHEELLRAGDAIYYDSSLPHGMVAVDGPCRFLAFLVADQADQPED